MHGVGVDEEALALADFDRNVVDKANHAPRQHNGKLYLGVPVQVDYVVGVPVEIVEVDTHGELRGPVERRLSVLAELIAAHDVSLLAVGIIVIISGRILIEKYRI